MLKKKNNYIILAVTAFWILASCQNTSNTSNQIYNEVFFPLLDSLNKYHSIKGKTMIFGRHETEGLIKSISDDIKLEFKGDTTEPAKLALKLSGELLNPIFMEIRKQSQNYNIISGETNERLKLANKIYGNTEIDTVIINASKIIFSSKVDMGCFYFSVCAKNPSGYLVYIVKENSKWRILAVLRKWAE